MTRIFGLFIVLSIACLGCKPPAGDADPAGPSSTNETAAPAATNETIPAPVEKETPAEEVKPAEAAPEMKEEVAAPPMETAPTKPAEEKPAPAPEAKPEAAASEEASPESAAQPTPADEVEGLLEEKPEAAAEAEMKKPEEAKPAGLVETSLTPDNTLIQFVGTHVGDEPDPRTGKFSKFSGTAKAADGKLTEVTVDIETVSLETDIEKLTNHLKSPDFFDVRQHPEAKFVSKSIKPGDDGKVEITGDLTMLGTTKSITFPAAVTIGDDINLDAEFVIDRVEFGMDYSPDKVHKDVTMTIKVGK